jgi:hypothetical protein
MLFAPPASADSGRHVSVRAIETVCDLTPGEVTGYYICEYGFTTYEWPSGRLEYFITGTDHAVWHIAQDLNREWGEWEPFPGTWAQTGVFVTGSGGWQPTIGVIGADNRPWCNTFDGIRWQANWVRCYR